MDTGIRPQRLLRETGLKITNTAIECEGLASATVERIGQRMNMSATGQSILRATQIPGALQNHRDGIGAILFWEIPPRSANDDPRCDPRILEPSPECQGKRCMPVHENDAGGSPIMRQQLKPADVQHLRAIGGG